MFIQCDSYECINNENGRCTLGFSEFYPLELCDGRCLSYEDVGEGLLDEPLFNEE